jgi:hypothetical protein
MTKKKIVTTLSPGIPQGNVGVVGTSGEQSGVQKSANKMFSLRKISIK